MDEIEFVHLSGIGEDEIIDLMNNEMVGRQLPLLARGFSVDDCRDFLKAKKQLWDEHGYGPLAFRINGKFAGWGGLQPENGDADFALVLHPAFWGWGRKIFEKIRDQAFNEMNLDSVTALLPPGRSNSGAITRLGFIEDGQVIINRQLFRRYRLARPQP